MAGGACKQVLCLGQASKAAQDAQRQLIRGEYDEDEAESLRICAEQFIKDVMRIAEG